MNIHSIIDNVSISLGSLFISKYFRDGTKSSDIKEHLDSTIVKLPAINGEGDYKVSSETVNGKLDAFFRIAQWKGDKYPTIIYHHGASEIPFDFAFNKIFSIKNNNIKANLILIRAPYHASRQDFKAGMSTLNNFMAMLATSISLIEELIVFLREQDIQKIAVAGSSLGGYISNIHHIYYNSADLYIPLLAGFNLYDTLFESIYNKGVANIEKNRKKELSVILNFQEEFKNLNNEKNKVFPLLGENDQLVRYEVQKESYGDCPIKTYNFGHVTGALSYRKLREHILEVL